MAFAHKIDPKQNLKNKNPKSQNTKDRTIKKDKKLLY